MGKKIKVLFFLVLIILPSVPLAIDDDSFEFGESSGYISLQSGMEGVIDSDSKQQQELSGSGDDVEESGSGDDVEESGSGVIETFVSPEIEIFDTSTRETIEKSSAIYDPDRILARKESSIEFTGNQVTPKGVEYEFFTSDILAPRKGKTYEDRCAYYIRLLKSIGDISSRFESDSETEISCPKGISSEQWLDYIPEELKGRQYIQKFKSSNQFVNSLIIAFKDHRAIIISPDMMLTLFLQNLALFISHDPKLYQPLMVYHHQTEEKKKVRVTLDVSFSDKKAFYESSIDALDQAVMGETKSQEVKAMMGHHFTTTTRVDLKGRKVMGLYTMKEYFTYETSLASGIPTFKLVGTEDDWSQLAQMVDGFSRFPGEHFQKWFSEFQYIIDVMKESRNGNVDYQFWKDFIKYNIGTRSSSRVELINGHIVDLFAFLSNDEENPHLGRVRKGTVMDHEGLSGYEFPLGIGSIDVTVGLSNGLTKTIVLTSGFLGVTLEDKEYLRAQLGWFGVRPEYFFSERPESKDKAVADESGLNTSTASISSAAFQKEGAFSLNILLTLWVGYHLLGF